MARTFVWHPSKGPKTTPKQNLPETGHVRVGQVRGGIGHSVACAGPRGDRPTPPPGRVVKAITPGLKGQLDPVRHLVG